MAYICIYVHVISTEVCSLALNMWNGVERGGTKWKGVEWGGTGWNGVERGGWGGMGWYGVERGGKGWNGVESGGMGAEWVEWGGNGRNGVEWGGTGWNWAVKYICKNGVTPGGWDPGEWFLLGSGSFSMQWHFNRCVDVGV